MEYAREPETLPKNILTPGEARRIIEAADPSTILGYRDRVILETLYATGIRKTELLNLALSDVNLEEEILRINGGKGAKDRVVPLTRVAAAGLETYIKAVRPQLLGKKKSENLFPSLRRGELSDTALGHLVDKYARKANVKKHVTCHLWRHTLRDPSPPEPGQPAPRPGNPRPPQPRDDGALPAPDDHGVKGGAPQVPSP